MVTRETVGRIRNFGAGRGFDRIDLDELADSPSALDASMRWDQMLKVAKAEHPISSHIISTTAIHNRARQLPGCLSDDYNANPDKLGLGKPLTRPCHVICGRNGGRHVRLTFADGDLVVLDRDVMIRMALLLYFRMLPSHYSTLAAGAILCHSCVFPRLPFPFQEVLFFALIQTQPSILRILNEVLDFITLHEIGHIYLERSDTGRNTLRMEVLDGRLAELYRSGNAEFRYMRFGEALDAFLIPPAGDAREDSLLIPKANAHFMDEFFCDSFALVSRLILDASGRFTPEVFENLPFRLHLIGQIMHLFELLDGHIDGVVGDRRNVLFSFQYNDTGDTLNATPALLQMNSTHPRPFLRWQSIAYHARFVALPYFDLYAVPATHKVFGKTVALFEPGLQIAIDAAADAIKTCPAEQWTKNEIETFDRLDEMLDGYWKDYPVSLKAIMMQCVSDPVTAFLKSEQPDAQGEDFFGVSRLWNKIPLAERCYAGQNSLRLVMAVANCLKLADRGESHPLTKSLFGG